MCQGQLVVGGDGEEKGLFLIQSQLGEERDVDATDMEIQVSLFL